MRYFTSDLHFFDEGIIGYCGRPFLSAEEMNSSIVHNFKSKLVNGGDIYILGDLLGVNSNDVPPKELAAILDDMGIHNPNISFHLIMGNHDVLPKEDYLAMGFVSVKKIDFITIGEQKVMLTHDPCMVQQRNTLAVCGHIHTLFGHIYNHFRNTLTINVGVERCDYAPVSEEEIMKIIKNTGWCVK